MKKLSLKERILYYLRTRKHWIPKGTLQDEARATEKRYLGDTTGRVCRELHEEGLILCDKKERNSEERHSEECIEFRSKSVSYRAKAPTKVDRYIVKGEGSRPDKKLSINVYE